MISNQRKNQNWRSFEEARAFVRSLGLKSRQEWYAYCRSGQKPVDIPATPSKFYREQFRGYGDWLGSGNVANHKRVFRSFEEARAFVQSLGLKSQQEWRVYCHSGQKPADIPSHPDETYRPHFQGYSDWLGNDTAANGKREFLPFEEARAFVRSLGLKDEQEWRMYCHSGQKPEDIPHHPHIVYREQFQGIADWIRVAGKWSKKSLLAFLEHLQKYLPLLTEKELSMIIQQEGAFPVLCSTLGQVSPLQALQQIWIEHIPGCIEQGQASLPPQEMSADDAFISTHLFLEDGNASNTGETSHPSLPVPRNQENKTGRETASQLSISPPSSISKQALHGLDQFVSPLEVDAEVAEYLIANRVQHLWELYTNVGAEAVDALLVGDGGPFFTAIKHRFQTERQAALNIAIPAGWSFHDSAGQLTFPNAMQRWTAWQVLERRRVGNWSGTGTGKTLAAILASRVMKAQLTLIVTNYSTIESWQRHIHTAYPESLVLTNTRRLSLLSTAGERTMYLVLNYEKFQQRHRRELIQRLSSLRFDFVVLDEIQLVKQRHTRTSHRRTALEILLTRVSEHNPDLCVLGLSATPVINNLVEGKKLLELVMGRPFPEIDARRQTVNNALRLHRALMQYGFRVRPSSPQRLDIKTMPIIRNDLCEVIQQAQHSILQLEQALLSPKLDVILDHISPGTLIYTHYVQGMIAPIQQRLRSRGYSVGLYTGDEKSGLKDFLNGAVEILIGSSPVGTGLDGLQTVCRRIIFLSLPWTGAEFEQIIGRMHRQGSLFEHVEIFIPQVLFLAEGLTWSWDQLRMKVIETKRTLCDCVLDGQLPQALSMDKEALLRASQQALDHWIERVRQHQAEMTKTGSVCDVS
jgi:hypothetical protein